jgi:hypothetical protein
MGAPPRSACCRAGIEDSQAWRFRPTARHSRMGSGVAWVKPTNDKSKSSVQGRCPCHPDFRFIQEIWVASSACEEGAAEEDSAKARITFPARQHAGREGPPHSMLEHNSSVPRSGSDEGGEGRERTLCSDLVMPDSKLIGTGHTTSKKEKTGQKKKSWLSRAEPGHKSLKSGSQKSPRT